METTMFGSILALAVFAAPPVSEPSRHGALPPPPSRTRTDYHAQCPTQGDRRITIEVRQGEGMRITRMDGATTPVAQADIESANAFFRHVRYVASGIGIYCLSDGARVEFRVLDGRGAGRLQAFLWHAGRLERVAY